MGTYATGLAAPPAATAASEVVEEFMHGWRGYAAVAFGQDEVRPRSRTAASFFAPGTSFGLSILEALDTLYLMGQDEEVERCVRWIEESFEPDQDVSIHVFEAVIRLVGGLLSGFLATGRPRLLDKCAQLADRLLPAFTASPHGIPYPRVNLRTGEVDRGARVTPLAEAGTNIMEFGLLSRLTGDQKYVDASMRAYEAVMGRRSSLGLLGSALDAESGRWTVTASVAPNPPVDSFYEYLWGGYALLGEPYRQLREWYVLLTDAVLRYQADTGTGRLWFRKADSATGQPPSSGAYGQCELAAFYAGLLAKGGRPAQGAEYYRSWTDWLNNYPVLPRDFDYRSRDVTGRGNALLPEYANSAFDLWRLATSTEQQELYRRTAYQYFDGMRANQKVPGGYTVADDVTVRPMELGDATPGYWFAENLKYVYLMFADCPRFDYRDGLLSTEGKVLRGLIRT